MKYTTIGVGKILDDLESRSDPMAIRMKKYLQMPDLSRRPQTPIYYIIEAIKKVESLKNHDLVDIPEIVTVRDNFDLLGAPQDHPSRNRSDTFYLDDNHILRPQTTSMWSYYLKDPVVLQKLENGGNLLALAYGKVYRNDEIDRYHYPVWHNIDGICLTRT